MFGLCVTIFTVRCRNTRRLEIASYWKNCRVRDLCNRKLKFIMKCHRIDRNVKKQQQNTYELQPTHYFSAGLSSRSCLLNGSQATLIRSHVRRYSHGTWSGLRWLLYFWRTVSCSEEVVWFSVQWQWRFLLYPANGHECNRYGPWENARCIWVEIRNCAQLLWQGFSLTHIQCSWSVPKNRKLSRTWTALTRVVFY